MAYNKWDEEHQGTARVEVVEKGKAIMITHWKQKSGVWNTFFIHGSFEVGIVLRYMKATQKWHGARKSFWWQYRGRGRGSVYRGQKRGHNYWYSTCFPRVATILGLKDAHRYTGHCMRRFGASALANSGCSIRVLKRFGCWKSATIAEQYVEQSHHAKQEVANKLVMSDGDKKNESMNELSGDESSVE
eukprot:1107637_1